MKKLLVCLLMLAMLASLAACSSEEQDKNQSLFPSWEETDSETEPESEKSATETAPAPVASEPEVSYEDQIALIAANCSLWMDDEEVFSTYYSYTVTDLDQNGRLEVLFAACVGTGHFTYADFWEISESFDGLVYCEPDNSEDYSQVDLIRETATVYFDEAADSYYYIMEDYVRSGWAWNGSDKRALILKDGVVYEENLASRSSEYDTDGNETTTYYDVSGNVISQEVYDTMDQEIYAYCEKMQASFLWQNIDSDGLSTIENAALLEALTQCWQAFGIG